MIVAAAGAAALGEWFEGGLLLFLFSFGHALEGYAMGRARAAIEALGDLAPATARVRRDGQEATIPVGELLVGDTVVIRPDERIAADGIVSLGTSAVDQSAVTGGASPSRSNLRPMWTRLGRLPRTRRPSTGCLRAP